jgi:hypothetical protein
MTEVKCETCGEAEATREIGAQWCHEAGVQEARAAAAEARIAELEAVLEHVESDLHLLAGKVSGKTLQEIRSALATPAARKDKES